MNKLAWFLCGLLAPISLFAQDTSTNNSLPATPPQSGSGDLEEVQNLSMDMLRSVTGIDMSADGKFLYTAAFNSSSVAVFQRNSYTGQLEILQSITDPDLRAAVSIRLSPDGKFAAVSAFGAGTLTLYKRDADTGKLDTLDIARHVKGTPDGLDFVIDARFSADNRFVYTAASNGVGVYKIEEGKLVFLQLQTGNNRLQGVRGTAFSPDGSTVYAAACQSGTLAIFRRNAETGELQTLDVLSDAENETNALEGAFRVTCSNDGKHVYVSSGRFGGDQAVSAFAVQEGGRLKLIEEHVNGVAGFEGFDGGNDIKISPDGNLVYALGTLSDRLVRFRRDSETGKLTFLGSQPVGEHALPAAAGLCFSPDGRYVYVADEASSSIIAFRQPERQ